MTWPAHKKAAVTLSFDDGMATTWAYTQPILAQRGLLASYNLICRRVGGSFDGLPLAGWPEWRMAHRIGHELAAHGIDHSPMVTGWQGVASDFRRIALGIWRSGDPIQYLRRVIHNFWQLRTYRPRLVAEPEADGRAVEQIAQVGLRGELAEARHTIQHAVPGCPVESFVYPAGRVNGRAELQVEQAGFRSARGLEPGWNDLHTPAFCLRAVSIQPGMTEADVVPWLDRTIHAGGWLVLVFHMVELTNSSGYPFFTSCAQLEQILDAIQSRPFWVAPQSQVFDYQQRSL